MIGSPGFLGERLAQARAARGLPAVALAELIGVASSNITLYEQGRQSPSPEVMDRISGKLNMPRDFFFKEVIPIDMSGIWYRSMSAATKTARARAEIRFLWLREIVAYLRRYLELPALNIPAFTIPTDPKQITNSFVDELASECRRFYKLGDGPIVDLVSLLENSGIIISRGELGAETLDAFSQCPADDDRPYIFLGIDKGSAVRSRFDCAHELGHVIMHRGADPATTRNSQAHALLEHQGHLFASTFLLPESGFMRELYAPTLDAFAALKPRWRVSIAMMIKRSEDLGVITPEQAQRMWINLSRRGWRKQEPLDQRLVAEQPRVLRRCFEVLLESGVKTKGQIIQDLCLNASDIERLACLPDGALQDDMAAEPKLKPIPQFPGVIPFRPKAD